MLGWAPSVFALMLERMAYDYHIMTYTPLEREDGTELSVRAKTTKEKTTWKQ